MVRSVWSWESRNLRIEFEFLKCKRRFRAIVFEDKWKTVFLCSFVFTLSLLDSTGENSSVSCWLEFDWSQCRILISSEALKMQIRIVLLSLLTETLFDFDPSSFNFQRKPIDINYRYYEALKNANQNLIASQLVQCSEKWTEIDFLSLLRMRCIPGDCVHSVPIWIKY